jgi:sulfite reductase (NADPH) flavoprotein alpha-component
VLGSAPEPLTSPAWRQLGLFRRGSRAAEAVQRARCACRPVSASAASLSVTLVEDYALSPAPDALFELIGLLVGGERRQKAKALAAGQDPDGDAATLDVLAALEKFAPVHPDPEAFAECLEPLQPRLYSISSSPLVTPGEVHRPSMRCAMPRWPAAPASPRPSRPIGRARRARLSAPEGARVCPARERIDAHHRWSRHRFPIRSFSAPQGVRRAGRAWLFFGHQHEAQDFFHHDELRCWWTARFDAPLGCLRAMAPRRSTCRIGCAKPARRCGAG